MSKQNIRWKWTDTLVEIQRAISDPNDKWKGLTDASNIVSIMYDNDLYLIVWKYEVEE